jgi:hypothetical protein
MPLMIRLRRALGLIAAAWLLCQTVTLGVAPCFFACRIAGDVDLVECTCGHGADAICPMHHHSNGSAPRHCAIRSTSDEGAAMLASVFGLLGFLPQDTPGTILTSAERITPDTSSRGIDRPAPPDPPPPRA